MGLGGVAIVILPSIMCLKLTFSDGLGGIFFTFYKYFNYLGIDWMITMQKLSHYYHATATLLLCYGNTVIVLRQHGCSATAT